MSTLSRNRRVHPAETADFLTLSTVMLRFSGAGLASVSAFSEPCGYGPAAKWRSTVAHILGESLFAAVWDDPGQPPGLYVDELLQDCVPVWQELDFERRLDDVNSEAEDEGFAPASGRVLQEIWRLWRNLYGVFPAHYEVYPEPDGEVTLDVRDHKGGIVTVTVEPGGGALCIAVGGGESEHQRYEFSGELPEQKLLGWLSHLELEG